MTLLLALVLPFQEKAPMSDDALAADLVRIWGEVRDAFLAYRLDDAKKHLELPAGTPTPTREQARQLGQFLPDFSKGRRLKFVRDGKHAGVWVRFDKEHAVELAVARFVETPGGWKLLPGEHTVSSYETDAALDEAMIARLLATRGSLQLEPSDAREDLRPEAEVRKELEALYKKARTPEMPDLLRSRFIRLLWGPGRATYYAETKTGNIKATHVAVLRFERQVGEYSLASAEEVQLPPTGQAKLLQLIETDPKLKPR